MKSTVVAIGSLFPGRPHPGDRRAGSTNPRWARAAGANRPLCRASPAVGT